MAYPCGGESNDARVAEIFHDDIFYGTNKEVLL